MAHLFAVAAAALTFLSASASAAQAPSQHPVQELTVTLSSFSFVPDMLKLQSGNPYRLHFVNTSSGGHDFAAPEFFAASSIAAEDRRKIVKGRIRLHGKESLDIALTPERIGSYASRCTHFLHSSFGMKGSIIVE